MEKQKSTTTMPFFIGLIVGIAICLVGFALFVFLKAPEGEYMSFVFGRGQIAQPINTSQQFQKTPGQATNDVNSGLVDEYGDNCVNECIDYGYYIDPATGQPIMVPFKGRAQACEEACEEIEADYGHHPGCRDSAAYDVCIDICVAQEGELTSECGFDCYEDYCK